MKKTTPVLLGFCCIFICLICSAPYASCAEPPTERGNEILALDQGTNPSDETGSIADEDLDYLDEAYEDEGEEDMHTIADPIEPFNRLMYHFNDRLYFWILKPVSQVYGAFLPEPVRVSVRNFFTNLRFPIRFVNCILQANFEGATIEFSRFTVNTTFGLAGLFDPATKKCNLMIQDEDLGQTLGTYGAGGGLYITWPVLGPSTFRDSVGMAGDYFLDPVSYLEHREVSLAIKAGEKINKTSLSIGEYEALKEAAIDPYVSIRNVYIQYRQKKVGEKLVKPREK